MYTIYKMKADELDNRVLLALKEMFRGWDNLSMHVELVTY